MKWMKIIVLLALCSTAGTLFAQQRANLLQNTEARKKTTLNGLWDIIIDPLENGYYNHRYLPKEDGYFVDAQVKSPSDLIEYNFDTDYQLTVPGDWNTQMEKLYYYEGTVWFKKDFKFNGKTDELAYLYFEAVNYEATVYMNGKLLGTHIGGYTPFQFEVSGLLKMGDNFVVVKVDNKRKREAIPTINTDWWNYGGITRSVHLITTPRVHVSDYSLQLARGSFEIIEGWVAIANAKGGEEVTVSISGLSKPVTAIVKDGVARFSFKAKPILWHPANPKLYDVNIKLGSDEIVDRIGFRTIATKGSKILLNGKEIFLKGISIHEESPFKTGRVTSKEECLILLQWAKELGCNFVRLAHYPHSETMVREAEKMGLLVWSEIPVYWTVLFENEATYDNAQHQLRDMISRDKNRAAVVLWSVANETPEGEPRLKFLRNLIDYARALDNTRLITAALDTQGSKDGGKYIEDPLGEIVDVIGINSYCGWYSMKPEDCGGIKWASKFNKPMIMSEVGGDALFGLHGDKGDRWTEEYQADVFVNNIKMMRNIDFLAGVSPWILMDFRSARRHLRRIQGDFNRKGLISDQGMRKQAFFILQDYYLKENK